MLKRLKEAGKTTWASPIKSLLFKFGFGYVWLSQDVGNSKYLLCLFAERIKDCYLQDWLSKLNESSKAEHYRNFKNLLDVEKYLSVDLSFKFRSCLAKFRCSSHNLIIEKGRRTGLYRPFRDCPVCIKRHVHTLEDELQFFMVCRQ